MIDLDTLICILEIFYLLSFLMVLAAFNSGRRFGMKPLIIALLITFIQNLLKYFDEIADSFHRNVYFIIPIIVMSILTALVIMTYSTMSNAICQGLRSPVRRLAGLRKPNSISTSIVHNETILVKNNDEFVNKVMNNEKPVIVNFHAEWCEPCKILTPKLKELIEPLTTLDLAIVDVEDNAELVHTFEVKAVPAVIAISNGLIVDKFIGLVDTDMINNLIDRMSGKRKSGA